MLTPEQKNTLYNVTCNSVREMIDKDIYPFAILIIREYEGKERGGFIKSTPNMDDETVLELMSEICSQARHDLLINGQLTPNFFINSSAEPPQKPSMN